jgi:hypothetical protein
LLWGEAFWIVKQPRARVAGCWRCVSHAGCGEQAASLGELIAMSVGHLADDAVGAQEPQQATDLARKPSLIDGCFRWPVEVSTQMRLRKPAVTNSPRAPIEILEEVANPDTTRTAWS